MNKKNIKIGNVQLSPINVNEDYLEEWNMSIFQDFFCLTKNGELISDSLYRIGSLGIDTEQDYFIILKYVEATYQYDFVKKCYGNIAPNEIEKKRKYLQCRHCIIDKNGTEKKEFKQFEIPYLIKGSCIYSLDSHYYNIETGEFYCKSSNRMESSEFLILENLTDKNPTKKGIMIINKKKGSWTIEH